MVLAEIRSAAGVRAVLQDPDAVDVEPTDDRARRGIRREARSGDARLGEEEIAQRFVNAAKLYAQSPEALQLRAVNIIYETTKERGATILMPTAMVDAMNAGAVAMAVGKAKENG